MNKIIIFIFLLAGCGGNLDRQGALDWWRTNQTVAYNILELLKSSPTIERIEIDTRKELITNYDKFTDRALKVYRVVEEIMRSNNIEIVTFYELKDVTILKLVIDRYGLSIAGCSLSILYFSSDKVYEKNSKKHAVYSEKLKPNWYLEINGDKECIRHAQ